MRSVSPDACSPLIIGIAGLPGSGKTRLIAAGLGEGRNILDDINNNWVEGLERARAAVARGQPIVVSDIMFCHAGWRQRLAEQLGHSVAWICFANDPVQCVRNCTRRAATGVEPRSIAYELSMIESLSKLYRPVGDIRPVFCPPAG